MNGKSVAIALCAYVAGVATMLLFDVFSEQQAVEPPPAADPPAPEPPEPRRSREHVSPDVVAPSTESTPEADTNARGTVLRGRLVHTNPAMDYGAFSLHATLSPEDPFDAALPLGGSADPDSEGRFAITIAKAVVGAGYTVELEVYRAGTSTVVARADRSVFTLRPALDLGDVRFGTDTDVLVAGRAVDAAGAPVPGARLSVKFAKDRTYRLSSEYDMTAGADGAFSVCVSSDGSWDLSVVGTDGWNTPFEVPFEPGTLDLVVVVEEVARITGRISLTADLPLDGFEVVVLGEHAAAPSLGSDRGSTRGPKGFAIPAAQYFTIVGAPAGTYRLGLRRDGATKLLAETPEFDVRPPQTVAPALVLAVETRRMEAVVRGSDGVPIPGATVSWRDATGDGAFSQLTCDQSGLAAWTFSAAALEIVAHAAGYRVTRLEIAEDAVDIELQREQALRVRVRLPPGLAAVPDGVEASLRLVWFGPLGTADLDRGFSGGTDPYGAADADVVLDTDASHLDVLVGEPGTYGLQLRTEKAGSTSSTIGSFRLLVPAGGTVVTALLPFSRSQVDDFLREFAAK